MADLDALEARLQTAEQKLGTLERIEGKVDEIHSILYPDMKDETKPGLVNQVRDLLGWKRRIGKVALFIMTVIGAPIVATLGAATWKVLTHWEAIMGFIDKLEKIP